MNLTLPNISEFKQKAFQWAAGFDVACYMDTNHYSDPYGKYDALIAVGTKHQLQSSLVTAFNDLEQFRKEHQGWLFGFLTYDLKNEVEELTSTNPDHLQFPDLYFFEPEHLVIIMGDDVTIVSANASTILYQIEKQKIRQALPSPGISLNARFSKADYIDSVESIQQHIVRGDIYVTNFCQEFYADGAEIDPLDIFNKLNTLSPNPFACFFKHHDQYLICASPERFLAKRGNKLISQPIKGTAKRQNDPQLDELAKQQLQSNPKEQQENVMIVDLVRNDLTHSAKHGTVQTEELFGIYSFNQVHQMISTVICELDENISTVQAIKNAFPMGSMTGAPKISAMQLMEQYEQSKRGLYSGSVGYFSPDGDMDLNVVIRSLLYNAENKYLSLHVGSAITYDAVAEQEYEECIIKASAIFEVLGS